MKISHDHDFRIHVSAEELQEDSADYAGIYTVHLNATVWIKFVPDLSDTAPPWILPETTGADDLAREARLYSVLGSTYSVTPNPRLAGSEERIQLPPSSPPPEYADLYPADADPEFGVIWYVREEDWRLLRAELDELSERTPASYTHVRYSELGDTRLGAFLAERFLPSDHLSAGTRTTLGRG